MSDQENSDYFEEVNNAIGNIGDAATDCEGMISDLRDSVEEMKEQCDLLDEAPEQFVEEFDSLCELISDSVETVVDSIEAMVEQRVEQVLALESKVEDGFENQADELQEETLKAVASFTETLTEDWDYAAKELLNESQELFEKILEDKIRDFLDVAKRIEDTVSECISDLGGNIEGKITDTIEEQVKETMEAAVEMLAREAVDAIMTSQLQAQTTAYLSPYIPHLAVAKLVAPEIRRALRIMRAGF